MKKYYLSALLLSFGISLTTVSAQVVDTDTSDTISTCTTITTNISYKNRKNNNKADVMNLQDFLNSTGYLNSDSITGFFGRVTESAVAKFQKDNGLVANPAGFVGAGTRAKIKMISCSGNTGVNTDSSNVNVNTNTTGISQLTKNQVLNGFDQCGTQFKNGTISIGYTKYTELERTCESAAADVSLFLDSIIFADLDNDNVNEALVTMRLVRASSGGGLYIFKNVNGVARVIDGVIFGKGNGNIVSVNKNIIVVEVEDFIRGENVPYKETYKFINNKLEKVSGVAIAEESSLNNSNLPEGCKTTSGFSPVTGVKCSSGLPFVVSQSVPDVVSSENQINSIETNNWQKFSKYGFEIKRPTEHIIVADRETAMGYNFTFSANSQANRLIVDVQNKSWDKGIVKSGANCNEFLAGDNVSEVKINGISFVKSDVSKDFNTSKTSYMATGYCYVNNGLAYKLNKIITKNDVDSEVYNKVFNAMISSFVVSQSVSDDVFSENQLMEKLKNSTYTFSPIGKGEEGSNDIKVNMVAGQSKGSDGWFRNVVSVAVDKKTNRAIVALDITGGASSRLPAIVSFTNINDIPEQKDFVYLNYYRGTIKTVSFNDAGEVLVKFLEKDFTYHLDSLGKLIPVNETKNDSNIDSVINTWKNSDGFVKGEKYDGEHHARSLVNKSTFGSTYFGKTVPYAIMNESSHGNVAGGVWKVIIQPQQTNNTSDFVYEFNRVQGYNPWNIGSDITMNVAQISHELVADGQLLVTFRVSSDINFSNSSNACIKYGDYKATFTLDKVKHMYTPTSKKDVLIEAACLAQNRG